MIPAKVPRTNEVGPIPEVGVPPVAIVPTEFFTHLLGGAEHPSLTWPSSSFDKKVSIPTNKLLKPQERQVPINDCNNLTGVHVDLINDYF